MLDIYVGRCSERKELKKVIYPTFNTDGGVVSLMSGHLFNTPAFLVLHPHQFRFMHNSPSFQNAANFLQKSEETPFSIALRLFVYTKHKHVIHSFGIDIELKSFNQWS
jgi:hypothetical protein